MISPLFGRYSPGVSSRRFASLCEISAQDAPARVSIAKRTSRCGAAVGTMAYSSRSGGRANGQRICHAQPDRRAPRSASSHRQGLAYGTPMTAGPAPVSLARRPMARPGACSLRVFKIPPHFLMTGSQIMMRPFQTWVKQIISEFSKDPDQEPVRELTRIGPTTYGLHRQRQVAKFTERRRIAQWPLDVSPYLPSLVSRTGS